jgi:hypothetical protein
MQNKGSFFATFFTEQKSHHPAIAEACKLGRGIHPQPPPNVVKLSTLAKFKIYQNIW